MIRTTRFKTALILFVTSFAVYGLTLSDTISLDVVSANFGSWHLATTGSPWIEDSKFLINHPLRDIWVVAVAGHEVIARSPGAILASLPAYGIAQPDQPNHLPASITAVFLSAWAVVFIYLALAGRVSAKLAVLGACVFAFGTPVWAVAADALWPHTLTVLGIAGMAWAASTDRWWLVGVFGGVALTGRVHVAIVVAVLGLAVALSRRQWSIVLKVGIPSLMMLALTMVWNQWLYKSWNPTGAYRIDASTEISERYASVWLNQLGLWIAPDRGILVWTPVLIMLIPAIVRAWSTAPDWSRWLALGGLLYTLVQGWANAFHGGDAFWSQRLGLEFLASVTPLLVFSVQRIGRIARGVLPAVLGIQIFVIALGSVLNVPGLPAEEAWSGNAVLQIILIQPVAGFLVLAAVVFVSYRIAKLVGPVTEFEAP